MIDISEKELKIVKGILEKYLSACTAYADKPAYEVRVFGSRYKGTAKDYSDLDLVIVGESKIGFNLIEAIREAFQESELPFRVDVLDWHSISEEFRDVIKQGYEVIWQGGNNKMNSKVTNIIIYRSEDGTTKIDVHIENETVWLSQSQMVELFQSSKANISEHIKNIFNEGELMEDSVVRNFRTTAIDGKNYNVKHYNLDVIISVGYRVKSLRGTQFRIWATERLREYLIKGFTMNDDLLKKAGGGSYWKELLERIRDIRSSEKVFYRQLLDLFATSIDYDPKSAVCKQFFQIVQNKFHYAVNKQTSAEIIYSRTNAELPFMGVNTFSGEHPNKEDVVVAKNYLNEKELAMLNRMVSAFFDLAELHAMNHEPMYMADWLPQVDDFAKRYGKGVLENAGTISRQAAIEKATDEYRKYRKKIQDLPTAAERDYIETIKKVQKKIAGKSGVSKSEL